MKTPATSEGVQDGRVGTQRPRHLAAHPMRFYA
jgi:hypothetical protein